MPKLRLKRKGTVKPMEWVESIDRRGKVCWVEMSRMGFPIRLKSKEVEIGQGKALSKRARRRQSLMDVSVEGEEMEVLRSVPTSETSSSEKDRSKAILKEMFNGEKTYDNRTEEIHRSRRTTYREGKHSVAGTSNLLGRRPEGICN